mgnify:FL=1
MDLIGKFRIKILNIIKDNFYDIYIMDSISEYKDVFYPTLNNSAVVRALLNDRVWEKKIVNIFEDHITKDDVVIDIGTYIGTHTLKMSELAKKVISFEPQPTVSECVKKTLIKKNIKNVIHYDIALSNFKGYTHIHTNNDGDSSLEGFRDHKFTKKYKCKVDILDNLIFEPVKLIKIDVECSEWEVLCGACRIIEESKPIIILETFKTKKNMTELERFCECFDYDYKYISCDNYLLISNVEND